MTVGEVEAWLAQVEELGLVQQPSTVTSRNNGHIVVTATIIVVEKPVEIEVILPPRFPRGLPLVLLSQPDSLGFVPHVLSPFGIVCFADKEGLLLDRQHPDLVLTWVVERTLHELTNGVTGNREVEFMRELDVYWERLKGEYVTNFLQPTSEAATITSYHDQGERWIARRADELPQSYRMRTGALVSPELTTYLPLLSGTAFVPPRSGDSFWTIEQLRAVAAPTLAALSPKRRRQLFKKAGCWRGLLVLAVPLDTEHYSLIGVAYESARGLHPFDERATTVGFTLRPVSLHRWERSYLVPRGGGQVELASKRVLLIGCGAIGGFLAYELVRAGVRWLTVVDNDRLAMENMHRHVLGQAGVGRDKANVLRDELHRQFLYAEVTSVPTTIEQATADGKVRFDAFDLVVAATGDATLELYLNEELRALPNVPDALFTWLEPYGLGGHALLTHPSQPGCLQCLYARESPSAPLRNRMLFAAPDQHFSVALSGCGSLHTPYGAQDATQTATLAARLAIDALTGQEPGSPLRSWKGNKRAFKAAGFKLAPRYRLSEETLRREATLYINPWCHICGSRQLSPTI